MQLVQCWTTAKYAGMHLKYNNGMLDITLLYIWHLTWLY